MNHNKWYRGKQQLYNINDKIETKTKQNENDNDNDNGIKQVNESTFL